MSKQLLPKSMARRISILALLLAFAPLAHPLPEDQRASIVITPTSHPAVDDKLFICDYAGTERAISLNYAKRPPLPCEVSYTREQEGVPYETLWQANYDQGFCEKKVKNLLASLQAVGWQCQEFTDR